MSRSCEFCGGEIQEFARTRNHVWIGCRHCLRSWREDLDAASAAADPPGPTPRKWTNLITSTIG